MNARTYQLLRDAWYVVGHTYEGSAYCLDCCTTDPDEYGNRPMALFASDDHGGMCCDECGKVIGQ